MKKSKEILYPLPGNDFVGQMREKSQQGKLIYEFKNRHNSNEIKP
jgi:hypothetical protein